MAACVGVVVEIPDMTRGPLTDEERIGLPAAGIHLIRDDLETGERKPPGGVIRQYATDWFWHPDVEHARAAASTVGARCFIVGKGICIEIGGS